MVSRSPLRHQPTSFDIDVDVDLDAPTPLRPFDVRAVFDLDQTVANPDHEIIQTERALMLQAEQERVQAERQAVVACALERSMAALTPVSGARVPVRTPASGMPSIRTPPYGMPTARTPSGGTSAVQRQAESLGSLAPMAMEMPRSIVPHAPPSSTSVARTSVSPLPSWAEPTPRRAFMSPLRLVAMSGTLAVIAAIAAFAAASTADQVNAQVDSSPAHAAVRNAGAPLAETRLPALTSNAEPSRSVTVPMDAVKETFADGKSGDWKARLMPAQPAAQKTR